MEEKLQQKLAELEAELKSVEAQDPYNRDSYADENTQDDDAAEREDHTRVNALEDSLKEKIQKVEAALDRCKKGKYGLCVSCGAKIDQARLDILPEADLCISCSNKEQSFELS
ncbi:hypothetical protein A2X44_01735 [candidate division CPR3 bacterium GWF2_35_18]|uniref:DnaK suppressor protein n=1 Tax=candidate division CPR3 bacterium GW2011_GWF2_35_18 TaxID=1618350 RepID=A0A0G0C1G1_UNCC3|nr:MAG: DnaK suppressor protein [candidate division CPR3 bacterium GW2011_GWF2_35_18]KKP85715.1 MAG: DnaK suppressor protein [candidate division CPR3 bacterium GW2011_GWE2_35_7]OGB62721.1 MAG: hypothetical protein A2X44_01735 [candidate division CPR3 bacterium GWF2_35_18]OGB65747.1 MAG: hypothetical protein A2250_01995 [candidate division CPR3 bacterium RIFOXYA2_FULL_35_13]OGB76446.1 MAG: hypothetical protein A2476_03305 [candidate division CPR3 bacterium RIFOXYC2_FULL_35_7]OGB79040.1 MAG: hyp